MEKQNKNVDVKVMYYPKTTKGHDIACISFFNDTGELIESDRVDIKFDNTKMYFCKSKNGLRLTNNKIQMWANASEAKRFAGSYPLGYNEKQNVYFINMEERIAENESDIGSKLGTEYSNYTPHYGEKGKNQAMANTEEKTEAKTTNGAENIVIGVLLNKMIEFIDKSRYDDAKSMGMAIKSLMGV